MLTNPTHHDATIIEEYLPTIRLSLKKAFEVFLCQCYEYDALSLLPFFGIEEGEFIQNDFIDYLLFETLATEFRSGEFSCKRPINQHLLNLSPEEYSHFFQVPAEKFHHSNPDRNSNIHDIAKYISKRIGLASDFKETEMTRLGIDYDIAYSSAGVQIGKSAWMAKRDSDCTKRFAARPLTCCQFYELCSCTQFGIKKKPEFLQLASSKNKTTDDIVSYYKFLSDNALWFESSTDPYRRIISSIIMNDHENNIPCVFLSKAASFCAEHRITNITSLQEQLLVLLMGSAKQAYHKPVMLYSRLLPAALQGQAYTVFCFHRLFIMGAVFRQTFLPKLLYDHRLFNMVGLPEIFLHFIKAHYDPLQLYSDLPILSGSVKLEATARVLRKLIMQTTQSPLLS